MKKKILPIVATLFFLILSFFIFLPAIIKHIAINKIQKLTGRTISVKNLSLNYFKSEFAVNYFSMFEKNGTDKFAAFDQFFVKISITDLLRKKINIEKIDLINPFIKIRKNKEDFNFSDILAKFADNSVDAKTDTSAAEQFQFVINNITVKNGLFGFNDENYKSEFELSEFNFYLPVLTEKLDSVNIDLHTKLNNQTIIKLDCAIDIDTGNYKGKFELTNFQINTLLPYLKDYINCRAIQATISVSLDFDGNFKQNILNLRADNKIQKFAFSVANEEKPVITFDEFSVKIREYSQTENKNNIIIEQIELKHPNLFFGVVGEKNTYTNLVKNTFAGKHDTTYEKTNTASDIKLVVDKINIKDGAIEFKDYNLRRPQSQKIEKFQLEISDFVFPKPDKKTKLDWSMRINRQGILKFTADFFSDFSAANSKIKIENIAIRNFNEYSLENLAYPIKSGSFNFNSEISIKNRNLVSENIINFLKFEFGQKDRNYKDSGLPVKLAVAILRDRNKNIKLDVPISGNIDDPEFKLSRVIWYAVKNILVKAVTSPFTILAKLAGSSSEEELNEIKYDYMQIKPNETQLKQLEKLKTILLEREDLNIEAEYYTDIEEEYKKIALQNSKEKYFKSLKNYSDTFILSDTEKIEVNSIQETDTNFIEYLLINADAKNLSADTSIYNLCLSFIGRNKINELFQTLCAARHASFKQAIISSSTEDLNKRIVIKNANLKDINKTDKYPHYKIFVTVEQ